MPIPMQQRIELANMPRDPMNVLSSVRAPLVKLRNSARLSESKRKLLKETLEFVLSTMKDAPEDKGAEKAPEKPVSTPEPAPAPKAQPKAKRRATAKVDPASV